MSSHARGIPKGLLLRYENHKITGLETWLQALQEEGSDKLKQAGQAILATLAVVGTVAVAVWKAFKK
jgi:hypothetical protein